MSKSKKNHESVEEDEVEPIVWFCPDVKRFVLAVPGDGDNPLCLHEETGDEKADEAAETAAVVAYFNGLGFKFNQPAPIEEHDNV